MSDIHMINNLGDVSQDGNLDVLDLVSIVNLIIDGSYSSYENWAADYNLDLTINILDIISIINQIVED